MLKLQLTVCALLLAGISCAPGAPDGRIVNGTDSMVERWPFVVSMRSKSGSHSCGASIISEKFVMTAAHCTNGRQPSDISIQYGVTHISASGPNVVAVKRIIQHPQYTPSNSYANDISLLEVVVPFDFSSGHVAPVQLPRLNYATPQSQAGGNGVLIGWGLNVTGGYIQNTLQEVDLKVYSDAECTERHKGMTNPQYHICGGVDEGGKGQCSGDSGGPLIYNGQQVGIVSWSIKPCTVAPYPGVYCKVANYVDWIYQNQVILG